MKDEACLRVRIFKNLINYSRRYDTVKRKADIQIQIKYLMRLTQIDRNILTHTKQIRNTMKCRLSNTQHNEVLVDRRYPPIDTSRQLKFGIVAYFAVWQPELYFIAYFLRVSVFRMQQMKIDCLPLQSCSSIANKEEEVFKANSHSYSMCHFNMIKSKHFATAWATNLEALLNIGS